MTLVEQYEKTRQELKNLHNALLSKVSNDMVPKIKTNEVPLYEIQRINVQIGNILTILANEFDEYEIAESQIRIACRIGDKYPSLSQD